MGSHCLPQRHRGGSPFRKHTSDKTRQAWQRRSLQQTSAHGGQEEGSKPRSLEPHRKQQGQPSPAKFSERPSPIRSVWRGTNICLVSRSCRLQIERRQWVAARLLLARAYAKNEDAADWLSIHDSCRSSLPRHRRGDKSHDQADRPHGDMWRGGYGHLASQRFIFSAVAQGPWGRASGLHCSRLTPMFVHPP